MRNESRIHEEANQFASKDSDDVEIAKNSSKKKKNLVNEGDRRKEEIKSFNGSCCRCGRSRHRPEECANPLTCARRKKEGHVQIVCTETMPWDHIAPFCGFAAQG